MKPTKVIFLTAISTLAAPFFAFAGEFDDISIHKQPYEAAPDPVYEAGRGLITLEGPSGMFINPTSATLNKGQGTLQYCMYLPTRNSDVIGNGIMASYGVTDWFEFGLVGNYVSIDGAEDFGGIGPMARLRFLKNDGFIPQMSIGGYYKFGDDLGTSASVFTAAYWRIPINEDGFFKSLGIHGGVRENWYDVGPSDAFRAYTGIELQLPYRLYLVSEVTTEDDDRDTEVPYSFGAQWRLYGINLTVAGIQNGTLPKGPAVYWGIGAGFQF
jgi:hypothetical protein